MLINPAFDQTEREKFKILELETKRHQFDQKSFLLFARLKHIEHDEEIRVIVPIPEILLNDTEALENIAIIEAFNWSQNK